MSFIEQFTTYTREFFENIELEVIKECFDSFLNNLSNEIQVSIIGNKISLPEHVLEGGDFLNGLIKLEEKSLAIGKFLLPKAYLYYETTIEGSYKYSEYICLFLDYISRNSQNIIKKSIFYNNSFMEHFKVIGLNEKEIIFILSLLGDLNFIKLIWHSNPNPHENDPLYEDLQIHKITTKGLRFLQTKCIIKMYNDLIRFIKQIRDNYLDEDYVGAHLKILAYKLEQDHNNWVINYLRIDFIHEKQESFPIESKSTDNKAIFYQEIIDIDNLFSNFTENGCVYESKNHRFFFDEKLSVPFNIKDVKKKFNTNNYQYGYIKCEEEINLIFISELYSPTLNSYFQKIIGKYYIYNGKRLNGLEILKRYIGFSVPMDNPPNPLVIINLPIKSFYLKHKKSSEQNLNVKWNINGKIKDSIYLTYKKDEGDEIKIDNNTQIISIEKNFLGNIRFRLYWSGLDDLLPNECILYEKDISYKKYISLLKTKEDDDRYEKVQNLKENNEINKAWIEYSQIKQHNYAKRIETLIKIIQNYIQLRLGSLKIITRTQDKLKTLIIDISSRLFTKEVILTKDIDGILNKNPKIIDRDGKVLDNYNLTLLCFELLLKAIKLEYSQKEFILNIKNKHNIDEDLLKCYELITRLCAHIFFKWAYRGHYIHRSEIEKIVEFLRSHKNMLIKKFDIIFRIEEIESKYAIPSYIGEYQISLNDFCISIYMIGDSVDHISKNQSDEDILSFLDSITKKILDSSNTRRNSYDSKENKENFEDHKESINIMTYLLECSTIPDAIQRKEGDSQIQQLAHLILGNYSTDSEEKMRIVDIGAGYGDLISAINNSGIASKIFYIPIEIDKNKWKKIEQRCRDSKDLEFIESKDNIDNIKKADLIFFINVFHELDLPNRVSNLYNAFRLTQKQGKVIIHEVVILPRLEKDFFMWDKDDYELILSKMNVKIDFKCSTTLTHSGGLPLQTICLYYNDDNLISEENIKSAIITSLEQIKNNWFNRYHEESVKQNTTKKRKRYIAFLMAQHTYAETWCKEHISPPNLFKRDNLKKKIKSDEKKNDIVIDHNSDNNPSEKNTHLQKDSKFSAKINRLKREIIEYHQQVDHNFLTNYEINYGDLSDINKLPILFEMLKDMIVKNENLRMIGYSSEERKIQLKSLRDYFISILND
ncbi:hypothetical protein LCGC14_1049260 [marine sediment metagenome]|uniref:Methyltransferase domain-containing protein n=1 Tax=marine sediment metagenome TaxID=412755 RepID=A0A0F9MPC4_9ZZZZ